MARTPERGGGRSAPATPTPRPGAAPTPAKKAAPARRSPSPSPAVGSPTGGARPANDHALVSGGPFWGNPDAPDYAQQNIVTVRVGGVSVQVNAAVATQTMGFLTDLIAAGYKPKSVQGYNNRAITGGSGKSNHAYGAAFDIDPGDNPRFVGTDGKHKIDDNTARILAAKWGFKWGGDYKDSKDYMHFEALGAPRTPGSPPGGTAPVITPAAKAAGATGPVTSPGTVTATTGGRTAAPVAGPMNGQVGAPLPPNATPLQIDDYVKANYAYLAPFLNIPEVGKILRDAALHDYSLQDLQGALSKTDWWKTTSATARQWDALNLTDHATAKQQVDTRVAEITDTARRLGISLTGLQPHDIAVRSLRLGYSPEQITAELQHQGKADPTRQATNVAKLRQSANEWMVPMSDAALKKWAEDIAFGKVTDDDYDQYLKEQAKSLFPNLAGAIDRGVTVKQYTDPYRQYAADILEISPNDIDFMKDPKFSKALFNTDPKTGERTQMSLADWQRYLRTTPDYNKTAQAVDGAAQFASMLTNTFGKVA